ncbi:uncharacterized protein LOC132738857 isoform X2 [Ruditapes philippinarum]|uniref:uncharacterized protein LOC132738857 isoform X2 n=1 Tax=Ruditapes philippinarum TaxID=129788 RepID=UPI00295C0BE3|nr:uncharacterized protein LOC132738857 isoform X2 [Ruditapes philippinarum]
MCTFILDWRIWHIGKKMINDENFSFDKISYGKMIKMPFNSVRTLMPENLTSKRSDFLQTCRPQTLIDVCRLRQFYQNLIPSHGSREHIQLYEFALEINKGHSNNDDLIEKYGPVGDMDSKDQKEFSFYEISHDRINILLYELKSLEYEIDSIQASRSPPPGLTSNKVSSAQKLDDIVSADNKSMTDVTNIICGHRRNLIQHAHSRNRYIVKLQVGALSVKNSCSTRYKNSIGFSVENKLDMMTHGYFIYLIYLETKTTMMEVIIMDCKLHVKVLVEHIQQWMYSIHVCEGKLDEKKSLQMANEHMIDACTHQKDDTDQVEVDNRTQIKKEGDSHVIQAEQKGDKLNVIDEKRKTQITQMHGWVFWFLKVLLWTIVILRGANAIPLDKQDTKKLLTSKTCNHDNFYSLKSKCHTNGIDHNLTIFDFCEFHKQCSSDEHPVCLNIEKVGVYVCLQRGLSCSKGRKIITRRDDQLRDIVHLEEVDCPIGTFQPTDSDCIQACLYKHTDMAYLGERFAVSSEGDNVNPTFVYCNYKKGYYNPEGKFTLNFDQDLIWNPDFCLNENKCQNGQFHLPDGRCVSECEHGFDRSPPDFHCKKMNITNRFSSTAPMTTTTLSTSKIVPSTANGSLASRITTQKITTDGSNKVNEHEGETSGTFPWWGNVLLGLPGLVLFIGIGVGVYKRKSFLKYFKGRCRRYEHNEYGKVNYRFNNIQSVNIYQNGNGPRPDDILLPRETTL